MVNTSVAVALACSPSRDTLEYHHCAPGVWSKFDYGQSLSGCVDDYNRLGIHQE
jgi:hypothetical protein